MSEPWILATLAACALALLALMWRGRAGRDAATLVALAAATVSALGAAADPRVWGGDAVMASIAGGSSGLDPRSYAALALAAVALFALPGLIREPGGSSSGLVSALTPGAVAAAIVVAGAAFLGLRAGPALLASALGAFALGVAIAAPLRIRPPRGPRTLRALAVAGAALTSVAVTLVVYGARTDPFELVEGAAIDTLGTHVHYHGEATLPDGQRRLTVTLLDVRGERRLEPRLWRDSRGRPHRAGAGDWRGGPVVVPVDVREVRSPGHAVAWLRKDESIAIPGGSLRFEGFRMEGRDTVRLYADLVATRGPRLERVSPGVTATHRGEEPFAAELAGFGPVALAGIDADQKRVGLIMPHGTSEQTSTAAKLLIRMRPTLAGAWAGAALALLSALAGLIRRRAA